MSDVRPFVDHKKEIRFSSQPGGVTIGCYAFADGDTFDSIEALECRGIAFDASGAVVSRPLHKFFNVGEKAWLASDQVASRDDVVAIYEKIDGSMIATAWVDGELRWRSKKSFTSDVVRLATELVAQAEYAHIAWFARRVASAGMTAIFELTHPAARIVVAADRPELRLLHVRDNVTGAYVLLDRGHPIHGLVARYGIARVRSHDGLTVRGALESLADMRGREGYVIQFASGDMAKVKCPWYLRLHRSITFLRERDIASLALREELDDVKGALTEAGIDLAPVLAVEARLKAILTGMMDEIDRAYESGRDLDRKSFALANKSHPLFGLMMQRYTGREVALLEWYEHNRLRDDFGLSSIADDARAEAIEG